MFKYIAIVQARMGSSRLSGKVMLPLKNKTILSWVIDRLSTSRRLNQLYVATSNGKENDVIESYCHSVDVPVYRGSESDVFSRYFAIAKMCEAKNIVRLTADNPVVDGAFIDWMLTEYESQNLDYLGAVPRENSNLCPGLSAEVFSGEAIMSVDSACLSDYDKEHVTSFFYNNPSVYNVNFLDINYSLRDLRLTVDTEEDYVNMLNLFSNIDPAIATWSQIVEAACSLHESFL